MKTEVFSFDEQAGAGLTVYLHEEKPEFARVTKRPFILVIPGGGYSFCSEREAEPIALNFLAQGYHAGVLRYHVGEYRSFEKSLQDGQIALAKICELAPVHHIDETKIAVIGFSAGGHLAAALSTLAPVKPSLCILGYPAILKSFAQVMQVEAPSLESCVSSETPPTFLFSTFEDNVVPIENSLLYLRALEEHEVPFEAHIFQKGKHGLSLGNKWSGNSEEMIDPRFAQWFELCTEWLEINWQAQAVSKEVTINSDVWQVPIKELFALKDNRALLLNYLPTLADKSAYKIIRSFSFAQLCEMAPEKFPKSQVEQWLISLEWPQNN
jgi:acetyl esterase/lipase